MTTTTPQDSFLNEVQRLGKASGNIPISDMDTAINGVHEIINKTAQEHFHNTPEDQWETLTLDVYCLDCRAIVPPLIKKVRNRNRTVCGTCESKKISMGRAAAFKKFYHLD